ncbi:hypothetical protein GGR56DRAFT_629044 [Xylariaceae sp. FL0804]|nr:hypothetical protein GGR56DRAFT_629044 [Xylariaceae sp. FL0804]
MLRCNACRRWALTSFVSCVLPPTPSNFAIRRTFTAFARNSLSSSSSYKKNPRYPKNNALAASNPSSSSSYKRDPRNPRSNALAASNPSNYLDDPLHIANRVEQILAKDDFDTALSLVKKTSINNKVTVSWNHLIDYQLKQGKLRAGLKTYNEMKKRQQLPNAQTYTILLRGFARSDHPKIAVAEGVKMYHNMLASSRLQPNTIHMNAIILVCAKANDLESMFTVLQSVNTTTRKADNFTYATILNALRAQIPRPKKNDVWDRTSEELKQQAIHRATSIWDEVKESWQSGTIMLDEELVCAMGRVLLLGSKQDAEAVTELVNDTMLLPGGRDRTPTPAEKQREIQGKASEVSSKSNLAVASRSPSAHGRRAPMTTHALPGRNSLSMVLQSIQKTGKTTEALRYWGIFTTNYHVEPDWNNWLELLKTFKVGRASSRTADYLPNMPQHLARPRHFQVAMSACLKDNINPSAVDHATKVLHLMVAALPVPDVKVLHEYHRLGYAHKQSVDRHQSKDKDKAWEEQMAAVLRELRPPLDALLAHCGFVASSERGIVSRSSPEAQQLQTETIALVRKIMAAYDRLAQSQRAASRTPDPANAAYYSQLGSIVAQYYKQKGVSQGTHKREQGDITARDANGGRTTTTQADEMEEGEEEEEADEGFLEDDGGRDVRPRGRRAESSYV